MDGKVWRNASGTQPVTRGGSTNYVETAYSFKIPYHAGNGFILQWVAITFSLFLAFYMAVFLFRLRFRGIKAPVYALYWPRVKRGTPVYPYVITVARGFRFTVHGAMCDTVRLLLRGSKGRTDRFTLLMSKDNPETMNMFCRGSHERLMFATARPLRQITELSLDIHSEPNSKPWYLSYITVLDVKSGSLFYLPYHDWIETDYSGWARLLLTPYEGSTLGLLKDNFFLCCRELHIWCATFTSTVMSSILDSLYHVTLCCFAVSYLFFCCACSLLSNQHRAITKRVIIELAMISMVSLAVMITFLQIFYRTVRWSSIRTLFNNTLIALPSVNLFSPRTYANQFSTGNFDGEDIEDDIRILSKLDTSQKISDYLNTTEPDDSRRTGRNQLVGGAYNMTSTDDTQNNSNNVNNNNNDKNQNFNASSFSRNRCRASRVYTLPRSQRGRDVMSYRTERNNSCSQDCDYDHEPTDYEVQMISRTCKSESRKKTSNSERCENERISCQKITRPVFALRGSKTQRKTNLRSKSKDKHPPREEFCPDWEPTGPDYCNTIKSCAERDDDCDDDDCDDDNDECCQNSEHVLLNKLAPAGVESPCAAVDRQFRKWFSDVRIKEHTGNCPRDTDVTGSFDSAEGRPCVPTSWYPAAPVDPADHSLFPDPLYSSDYAGPTGRPIVNASHNDKQSSGRVNRLSHGYQYDDYKDVRCMPMNNVRPMKLASNASYPRISDHENNYSSFLQRNVERCSALPASGYYPRNCEYSNNTASCVQQPNACNIPIPSDDYDDKFVNPCVDEILQHQEPSGEMPNSKQLGYPSNEPSYAFDAMLGGFEDFCSSGPKPAYVQYWTPCDNRKPVTSNCERFLPPAPYRSQAVCRDSRYQLRETPGNYLSYGRACNNPSLCCPDRISSETLVNWTSPCIQPTCESKGKTNKKCTDNEIQKALGRLVCQSIQLGDIPGADSKFDETVNATGDLSSTSCSRVSELSNDTYKDVKVSQNNDEKDLVEFGRKIVNGIMCRVEKQLDNANGADVAIDCDAEVKEFIKKMQRRQKCKSKARSSVKQSNMGNDQSTMNQTNSKYQTVESASSSKPQQLNATQASSLASYQGTQEQTPSRNLSLELADKTDRYMSRDSSIMDVDRKPDGAVINDCIENFIGKSNYSLHAHDFESLAARTIEQLYATVRCKLKYIMKMEVDENAQSGWELLSTSEILAQADSEVRNEIVPTIVEQMEWKMKEDPNSLKQTDCDLMMIAHAGHFVDMIITNAVVRSRHNLSQNKNYTKTFIAMSDLSKHFSNGNYSNTSNNNNNNAVDSKVKVPSDNDSDFQKLLLTNTVTKLVSILRSNVPENLANSHASSTSSCSKCRVETIQKIVENNIGQFSANFIVDSVMRRAESNLERCAEEISENLRTAESYSLLTLGKSLENTENVESEFEKIVKSVTQEIQDKALSKATEEVSQELADLRSMSRDAARCVVLRRLEQWTSLTRDKAMLITGQNFPDLKEQNEEYDDALSPLHTVTENAAEINANMNANQRISEQIGGETTHTEDTNEQTDVFIQELSNLHATLQRTLDEDLCLSGHCLRRGQGTRMALCDAIHDAQDPLEWVIDGWTLRTTLQDVVDSRGTANEEFIERRAGIELFTVVMFFFVVILVLGLAGGGALIGLSLNKYGADNLMRITVSMCILQAFVLEPIKIVMLTFYWTNVKETILH